MAVSMSTTTFPTSSSAVLELEPYRYDLRQVDKLVRDALGALQEGSKPKAAPAPPITTSPPLFHFHTFDLDITLLPPNPWQENWGRPATANPAYEAFELLRTSLLSGVEPLVPLQVLPPTPHVIHIGANDSSYRGYNDFLILHIPKKTDKTPQSARSWTRPLARLTALPCQAAKEWMPNSKAVDLQHWLTAALALDPDEPPTRKGGYRDDKRRMCLSTGIQVCWVPDGEGVGAGSEIKLLVTVEVKVDWDAIQAPLPDIGRDLLGLVLHSLLPSPTVSHPQSEAKARAAALRNFFACLRPAPDHPITLNVNALQPQEMVSKLLPFQTRTLSLLRQREVAESHTGADPKGFWETYDLGPRGKIAFRRTTGDLIFLSEDRKGKRRENGESLSESEKKELPMLLDLSGIRGTMLCEEMGLGKTLEALALTLIHPHPLSVPRSKLKDSSTFEESDTSSDVPVIDLFCGPPGLDTTNHDDSMTQWYNATTTAFEGRSVWDQQAQLNVSEVGATLIVTPALLLKQWVSEIQKHAPGVRVCVYDGWKSLQKGIERQRAAKVKAREQRRKRKAVEFRRSVQKKYQRLNGGAKVKVETDDEEDVELEEEEDESSLQLCQRRFLEYVRAHDIVITTYNDLSNDLKVALPAPTRSRRSNAKYNLEERPRSPLVMVEWWRVIMDEVQLHGEVSDAANMVSLVPRRNSLAVSGTPARTDVRDLMGSLKFLRVPVLPHDGRLWHRLQQPAMRSAFEGLFQSLAVRTTKAEVAHEFKLPSQSRFVIPIELSEVELVYYNDTLDRQRELLHLPLDPTMPRERDWRLDHNLFRACLTHLRQICTHVQVGQLHVGPQFGRVDRLHLGRQLMTMSEALEKMKSDHAQEFLIESRQQMREMIKKAQLMMQKEDDDLRFDNARLLYEKVRQRIEKQLPPLREHLDTLLKARAAERARDSSVETDDPLDEVPSRTMSQQAREKIVAIQAARQAIRETLFVEHQAWFLEGDVHHIRKEVDQEVECYEKAESIRKELLQRPLMIANGSVGQLERALKTTRAVEQVDDLRTKDTEGRGGILSNSIIAQANELRKILNGNAELVFHWRRKIIELLSSKVDGEAEELLPGQTTDVVNPEEEYYAEALKAQGDVEGFLIAYAAAIADRKEFLLEERSLLATHDARVTKQRTTKPAIEAQIDVEPEPQAELAEQVSNLMAERETWRHARDEKECKRPLKGLVVDLNAIVMGQYSREELAIAKGAHATLKAYTDKQTEYVSKLLKELEVFRETFNRRVVYFKALQEISDLVTAPESKDIEVDIAECTRNINKLEAKLSRMTIKGRYLSYLGTKDKGDDELREDCIICMGSSDDTRGVLLECGHFFCQSCFTEYKRTPHMGRRCPSCREPIAERGITKIKLAGATNPKQDQAMIETTTESSSQDPLGADQTSSAEMGIEMERQRRAADLERLRYFDTDVMREVALMDMMGEYGSKINFLIKHLLWYKSRDPEARHVIFSNWSDSMNIVQRALTDNRISFVSFDQKMKKQDVVEEFRRDTSISVFLLHAERESSGLTLTSCRVVHLLEPVLRHSFELQAIGRVDRLGQENETTVYCYATQDTVESRILSQGVRNGTSIYLKDESADSVVASMPNVVSAAHKGGDLSNTGNEEQLLGLIL